MFGTLRNESPLVRGKTNPSCMLQFKYQLHCIIFAYLYFALLLSEARASMKFDAGYHNYDTNTLQMFVQILFYRISFFKFSKMYNLFLMRSNTTNLENRSICN